MGAETPIKIKSQEDATFVRVSITMQKSVQNEYIIKKKKKKMKKVMMKILLT